jgi:hypothetical protein
MSTLRSSSPSPPSGRTAAEIGYAALVLAAVINLAALWATEKSYDRLRGNTDVAFETQ